MLDTSHLGLAASCLCDFFSPTVFDCFNGDGLFGVFAVGLDAVSFPDEDTGGTLATTGTLATGFGVGVGTLLGSAALLGPPDFVDAEIPLPTRGGARLERPLEPGGAAVEPPIRFIGGLL